MVQFLKSEFTLERAASKVLWTILFAILTRALFWLLNVSLAYKELWYWLIVPAIYLAAIIAFTGLARGGGPQIAGEIEWISIDEIPPSMGFPPGSLIVLIVLIRNIGEATSLEGWSLSLQTDEQPRLETIPFPCPETMCYPQLNNMTLVAADSLHNKLAHKILEKGERVRGLLLFDAVGVPPKNLGKPGQVFILSVQDYQERRWSINFKWKTQQDTGPRMFSGMTISVGTPPPPGTIIAAPPPAPTTPP